MRLFSTFFSALLAATAALAPATAEALTPLRDNRIIADVKARDITIESGSPETATLARRAFNAHGEFKVSATATRVLRLTNSGANAVSFVYRSGGESYSGTATGATPAEAVLRACDAVLVKDNLKPLFAGKIAFVSDRTGKKEIYASDLFLESVRPLSNYRSITVTPRWTYDGAEVLHTTYANNNFTDVYAVNVATGAQRDVIVGKRGTTTGAVSNPRTGQLAFASSGAGDMSIYLATATGGSIKRLAYKKDDVASDPAWAADGSRLAVTSGATGRPGIHIVTVPDGVVKRVSTGFGYSTEPAWNPVFPSKIAFTYNQGGVFKIGVVDTATNKIELPKLPDGHRFTNPVWCADGRHIVATRASGVSTTLVLIDTNTANQSPAKITVLSGARMANCSDADYFMSNR